MPPSTPTTPVTRRSFLGATALAAAVAPMIAPSRLFGAGAPSNRLRIGQLGTGRIARGHDMVNIIGSNLADIVAVCDVDRRRAREGQARVTEIRTEQQLTAPAPEVSVHAHFGEIVARDDIDAVVISTPEHWHAEMALAALYAGKDVYVQKPITLTHAEGLLVREAERVTGRILQVGSQQRSWKQFREGVALVRAGRLGRITAVEIGLPTDPTRFDDPPMPVPADLDYDQWVGPAPMAYYTEQRVHPQEGYDRPGWLRNEAFTLGMITGWGSHHFDIAHWGLDLDLSGPTALEGWATFPSNRIWNVHNTYEVQLTYPGGVRLTVSDRLPNGIRWIGEEGWIWVSRNRQTVTTGAGTAESPRLLHVLDASDPRLIDRSLPELQQLPSVASHHINWLESVKSRQAPLAPAAIGHCSNTACVLSWIAMKLARPLRWDAATERFRDDDEANALLARPERPGYGAARFMASRPRAA